MTEIQRIPITTALPVEVLRPELRATVENLMPTIKTERTRHMFIRDLLHFQITTLREMSKQPGKGNKTRYGGPLAVSPFFDRVGMYNPEKYPVRVLDKMRDDAQIGLGMLIQTGILRGLGWAVECADSGQKKFLEYAIGLIYPQMQQKLSRALYYGFASNEAVWKRGRLVLSDLDSVSGRKKVYFKRTARLITHLRDHEPSTVRVVVHPRTGDFLGISQNNVQGEPVYLEDDDNLVFFGIDQEYGNWFGRSRMVSSYKPFYWWELFSHYLGRYMERRGTPPVIVSHPNGRVKVDGEEMWGGQLGLRLGMALLEHAVVAKPSMFDGNGNELWRIEYLTDDKRAEMFYQILNYYDVLKIRGLGIPDRAIAQDLTPGGTSAGAQVSTDLLLITLACHILDMQECVQRKILEPLHHWNYSDAERVQATFKYLRPDVNRIQLFKDAMIEQIRQTPNIINLGRAPTHVLNIAEMARYMGLPVETLEKATQEVVAKEKERQEKEQEEPPPQEPEKEPEAEETKEDTEEMTEKELKQAAKGTKK